MSDKNTTQEETKGTTETKARLRAAGFTRLWSCFGPNDSTLTAYIDCKGKVLLLQDSGCDGFELYKPVSTSNDYKKCLDAAGI